MVELMKASEKKLWINTLAAIVGDQYVAEELYKIYIVALSSIFMANLEAPIPFIGKIQVESIEATEASALFATKLRVVPNNNPWTFSDIIRRHLVGELIPNLPFVSTKDIESGLDSLEDKLNIPKENLQALQSLIAKLKVAHGVNTYDELKGNQEVIKMVPEIAEGITTTMRKGLMNHLKPRRVAS